VKQTKEDQRRFLSLHLPSSSVDQPRVCERHCPHKLSHVLAIESRKLECATPL
jgi:hypothetical protein